jgi:hypothetical protein
MKEAVCQEAEKGFYIESIKKKRLHLQTLFSYITFR